MAAYLVGIEVVNYKMKLEVLKRLVCSFCDADEIVAISRDLNAFNYGYFSIERHVKLK